MIFPFIPKKLFEIGNFKVTSFDDKVLIVDDWYKNILDIHKLIYNVSVPIFVQPDTQSNFKDYYDCRYEINPANRSDNYKGIFSPTIISLIKEYFKDTADLKTVGTPFKFNYFKFINPPAVDKAYFHPHKDEEYNCVIYLDKHCSGGTCLYPALTDIETGSYNHIVWDSSMHEKIHIPAKINRLVIYKGKMLHGGYIDDIKYYLDDWRINQVIFMQKNESN